MGLFDIFSDKNAKDAAAAQIAGLEKGKTEATALVSSGLDKAEGSYAAGLKPFADINAQAGAGATTYGDATGANGPEGYARAISNFQTSPGFTGAVEQGSQNVMRHAAATGQLASGQTNIDLNNVAQNEQNKQWQSYITNLQPFLTQQTQGAAGTLQGNASLGNLQNANLGTQANIAYGSDVGAGNATASADLAKNTASANGIGAILGLGKLAASAAPGVGSFLSSFGA